MSIRKQYDTDLESLKNSLTEMGRNSADAVENALEALCVADADAAAAIVKGDARINNMERDIEHRCMTLLLRQQPVAGDLRRISTAMKVVTDIERIGDHAFDIARAAGALEAPLDHERLQLIRELADCGQEMVDKMTPFIDSLNQINGVSGRVVWDSAGRDIARTVQVQLTTWRVALSYHARWHNGRP